MVKKTVPNLIFDRFAEAVETDDLFKGISEDLVKLVRRGKSDKSEIENLLRREQNEDSQS